MKITIERAEPERTPCKHEVGRVYKCGDVYVLLASSGSYYRFIDMNNCEINNMNFVSIEFIDKLNPDDILVDAELIIREVK